MLTLKGALYHVNHMEQQMGKGNTSEGTGEWENTPPTKLFL